jgi:hypothetical protein
VVRRRAARNEHEAVVKLLLEKGAKQAATEEVPHSNSRSALNLMHNSYDVIASSMGCIFVIFSPFIGKIRSTSSVFESLHSTFLSAGPS